MYALSWWKYYEKIEKIEEELIWCPFALQVDEIFQLYQYNQKMREGTVTAIVRDWAKPALLAGLVEININTGIIIQSTYFLLFLS